MKTQNTFREPSASGSFYPAKKEKLEEAITKMLNSSNAEIIPGQIFGIISPHAGYIYSGQIAAGAYKQIQSKNFDNVIVIAPSHFEEFSGCSVFIGDYITPLGIIPTNKELANKFGKAVVSFHQVLKLHGEFALAHYNLALCYEQDNNKTLAKKHIEKAIELNPALGENLI